MGFCRSRYFMLVICFLQFIAVIQRQVFDFLGYLYIPILLNFFHIIFVIFGSFGAFQYRPKYIITYVLWNLVWLGWNTFLICLYLDIGILNHKENMVLKLDKESDSWWINGPGCKFTWDQDNNFHLDGCLLEYEHIEIFQCALQTVFAVLGITAGLCLSKIFLEEDDSSSRKFISTGSSRKKKKSASGKQQRLSLYSIEFSPQSMDMNDDVLDDDLDTDEDELNADNANTAQVPVSPKPMTPRRVKRRSVMQRGSSGRHSSSSTNRRTSTNNRSSTRSSGRRTIAQNPVTRLLEQQQQQQQQQQIHASYDSPSTGAESPPQHYYNNVHNGVVLGPAALNAHAQQQWTSSGGGHTNPTYQQSSTQSLNGPDFDFDLYNNRPASARSSYSNFHGTRPISYGGSTQPPAQAHYSHSHAAAQVPLQRRGNSSMRNNRVFLNNGPPGYSSSQQQHNNNPLPSITPVASHTIDSETTM